MEESEFEGYELDSNGRVIDPEIASGEKMTIKETDDFHLTYELLESPEVINYWYYLWGDFFLDEEDVNWETHIVPKVHCWVYHWTPKVKAELQSALRRFGPHVAVAPWRRPKLNKFIKLLGYEPAETVTSEGDMMTLYYWR